MQIEHQVPLAPFTTLRIGGPARFFARATSESQILKGINFARDRRLPLFILGGGSNLVVPDAGFPGLVLHIALGSTVHITHTPEGILVDADAGVDWDAFVLKLCQQGISGVECLAGIPGLVGGSPIQNIGAYGQEVASTIHSVTVLDRETFQFAVLTHAECGFSYRRSIFNSTHPDRYIVTQVTFLLDPSATPNLTYADLAPLRDQNPAPLDVYHAVRTIRDRKGMLIDPANPHPDSRSAGSFFKNPIVSPATLTHIAESLSLDPTTIPHWPVDPSPTGDLKLPAAWLIEQAGFPRGFSQTPDSPVAISSRHTLALINRTGSATCADLLALRDLIISTVRLRFHLTLEQEPVTLAPTPSPTLGPPSSSQPHRD